MKKFVTASFMLEMVIVDAFNDPERSDVQYDLRDRNGQLAVRGSLVDVQDFLSKAFENYKNQLNVTLNDGSKN